METRLHSSAPAAALKARAHPKLLALGHCEPAAPEELAAPMTPLAVDAPAAPGCAVFSPRDPATKLLAAKLCAAPSPASPAGFSSHRLALGSPTGSPPSAADEDDDDDELTSSSPNKHSVKPNTGRWTEAEHQLFLKGLETFPYRAWKKIATLIKTRTVVQIRTHAQKYYQKLEKEEARLKEREQQIVSSSNAHAGSVSTPNGTVHGHHTRSGDLSAPSTPLARSAIDDDEDMDASPRRRPLLRKRKCAALSLDEDDEDMALEPLPSLPKRMLREKKAAVYHAAHMSPKQKLSVAVASHKLFAPVSSAVPLAEYDPRVMPFRSGLLTPSRAAVLQSASAAGGHTPQHHPLPLDFADASADAMMLDLADEKSVVDLPFLDAGALDQSIDNDELLQLTDEELDWFSATSAEASAGASSSINATTVVEHECEDAPFALSRVQFAPEPAASDDPLVFADEDEDFVLDPEKFLSSYFGPAALGRC